MKRLSSTGSFVSWWPSTVRTRPQRLSAPCWPTRHTTQSSFAHRKDLDPSLAEIPAAGAAATYRELVERHRDLGDPEWRIRVAGELLDIGARLGKSGEAERSIEYNQELIRRFESTLIPEVQTAVARALFNKALMPQHVGEHKAALTAFNEVVKRFGESEEPDIQECVGAALLNTGFHHGRLGEPEAAIASFDDAIGRFCESLSASASACTSRCRSETRAPRSPDSNHHPRWTEESRPGMTSSTGSAMTVNRTSRCRLQAL